MTAFRQVFRSLSRAPLFTAAAVLRLGLGIGATAAAALTPDDFGLHLLRLVLP